VREINFLPEWYPRIRRQKRLVVVQSYMTLGLAGALGLWMFLAQHNVKSAEGSLDVLGQQMDETRRELAKLDGLLELRKQYDEQVRVIQRLGLHVESTRLLNALEHACPKEMAILELNFVTDDVSPSAPSLAAAKQMQKGEETAPIRKLKARLTGVVPTDVDLANFLAQLSNIRFLNDVAMIYAKDRTEKGHVMREFEVTFLINLIPSEEGAL